MSQHILRIGMSHSTMVTLDHSLWGEWAAQDASLAILFDSGIDGQRVTSGNSLPGMHVSNHPSPNRTYTFQRIRLSRPGT